MIYYLLQAVSTAIFGTVATVWLIEETLINLMMTSFLMVLRVACHPLMVLPTTFGVYFLIRKVWLRRRQVDGETSVIMGQRSTIRSPRIGSFRSIGSISSRSNDSCDYEDDEIRGSLRS
ncbi:uncharacterized protein LOC111597052 [Drosophila hydei]|uniref:Uncharacterized protein LOC111597052 n=1 Tax=Drosophila hydei TaxID=7224 RepID=A0A6J1LU13_DROHY|nr:uncharacterized protein LOC111597052 [Drosophila hydei]